MSMSKLTIRPAVDTDAAIIMQFIIDLAVYEKEPDAVQTNETEIANKLFCESPKVFCLLAEIDEKPVGLAIYFYNFSTWLGKNGIYLEDLFVSPEARGKGAGKALLQSLAKIAVAEQCGRVEWSVLNWNEPSIQFYKAMGAKAQDEWTVYRLTGDALKAFATNSLDESR